MMMMVTSSVAWRLGRAALVALVFALFAGALAGCDVQDAVENPGTIRAEDAGDDASQDAGDVGQDADVAEDVDLDPNVDVDVE